MFDAAVMAGYNSFGPFCISRYHTGLVSNASKDIVGTILFIPALVIVCSCGNAWLHMIACPSERRIPHSHIIGDSANSGQNKWNPVSINAESLSSHVWCHYALY